MRVIPTTNGNGFIAGAVYNFVQDGGLMLCVLPNGHERRDFIDGKPSAHLWDGVRWDLAGKFLVIPTVQFTGRLSYGSDHGMVAAGLDYFAEKITRLQMAPDCTHIKVGRDGSAGCLSIALYDKRECVIKARTFSTKQELWGFVQGVNCEVF